jgi:hypothetical protein
VKFSKGPPVPFNENLFREKEDYDRKLTKGPGQSLLSDLASFLQYGSGLSSDFLAKISGVDTPPFSWKTFYFPLSSLLLHSLMRCYISVPLAIAQLAVHLLMVQLACVPFPCIFLFFIIMEIMAMEDTNLIYF